MSIKVWGAFKLCRENVNEIEINDLSFNIASIANKNSIGIKLGFNVNNEFSLKYHGKNKYLPFELTDNPRSDAAEVLFSGDGVRIWVGDKRIDIG